MRGRSAHAVLTDKFVLLHVTSFQSGLPRDVVELAHTLRLRRDCRQFGERALPHLVARGYLPTVAIMEKNLPLLQRLYRYYQEQPVYQTDPRYMTFRCVWRDCLKYGDLPMVEWVDASQRFASVALQEATQ